MIPDVNVIVAAYRSDHPHCAVARAWLEQTKRSCALGTEALVFLEVVVVGFVRLVTNPKIFNRASKVDDAVAFIDALLGLTGVELRSPTECWPLLRNKLLEKQLVGNRVTDAWIASAAESLGENVVTFDRDFSKLLPKRNLHLLNASA